MLRNARESIKPEKLKKKFYKDISKEVDRGVKRYKRDSEDDRVQRVKALKDSELRNAKTYK